MKIWFSRVEEVLGVTPNTATGTVAIPHGAIPESHGGRR